MVVFLLIGVTVSLVVAGAWHSKLQAQDRQAFQTRASGLAALVGSSLKRDNDFMASLQAMVAANPELDNAGFAGAIAAVGAAQRYPGSLGYDYYQYVAAAGLPAFESQLLADPPPGVVTAGYRVTPPGARTGYCLLRLQSLTAPLPATFTYPAGLDVCVPGDPLALSQAIASAQFVVPFVNDGVVIIGAPVYGGLIPATAAGRQAAFTGWVAGSFAVAGLLPAAGTSSGLRTEILHRNVGDQPVVVAASGRVASGHVTTVTLQVQADSPWTVEVRGAVTGAGSSWLESSIPLLFGLLLTALLFGFVQVLARSRRHALRLVAERTGELRHQALYDALTDLPNRTLVLDRAQHMLARGRRDHLVTAALFMDLDGFKDVNDTYGHATGDRLLQAVAARISATLRDPDTAGRLGGDEFVVLIEGRDASPTRVAERLLAVLQEPFPLDPTSDTHLVVHMSIGIAVGDRDNAGDLLRDADIALYQAKGAGGNRYVIFSAGMQAEARDRVEIGMELRRALDAEEFYLDYQPTFNLRDMTVTGIEALIRWRHPGRGIVPPDDFIPIAEASGLIVPIGRWVLDTACTEAAGWQQPDRRLGVAVNISGRQLDTDGLVDDVKSALAHSGLPADLLTLEITETSLMRNVNAGGTHLAALKALGVRIAIDDFGTGYSSLSYLRQFHADAIKIDRSFISAMAGSPESAVIVRTLVQLGQALGIETWAEGIEEPGQLRRLRSEDCEGGQGFLLARPLSPEALRRLIDPNPAFVAGPAH